jgi:hypothetical protein
MLGKYDEAQLAFQQSHPVIEATFGTTHARTEKSRARMSALEQARNQSP